MKYTIECDIDAETAFVFSQIRKEFTSKNEGNTSKNEREFFVAGESDSLLLDDKKIQPLKFKIPFLEEESNFFTLFFLFESEELKKITSKIRENITIFNGNLWKVKILTFHKLCASRKEDSSTPSMSESKMKSEIENIVDKVIVENIHVLLKTSISISLI